MRFAETSPDNGIKKHTRLLIIDDHRILSESLKLFLQQNDYQDISLVHNVKDAQSILDGGSFNLAFLDINLGGKDGLQLISACRDIDCKVIVLSSFGETRIIKKAFEKGASGYILKESDPSEIVRAIESVTQGIKHVDQKINYSIANEILGIASKDETELPILEMLTSREREVLKRIALEMTSEEIAAELFISRGTVDTHRKNLMIKLQVKNSVGLGIWAVKNGML